MLWAKAWAQKKALDRNKEIVSNLTDFEQEGSLVICDSVTQDAEEAAQIIVDLRDCGLLPEANAVGLDPAGVPALLEELASHEIGEPMVAAVTQGYRLSSAIFGAERKLADGTLKHGGSALLTWCVANARCEKRGSNVYIDKRTASSKIDPLMASFNAVEMMSRNPIASGGPSVYESRGILMV
jgi:phage terminase large subunit-like protein